SRTNTSGAIDKRAGLSLRSVLPMLRPSCYLSASERRYAIGYETAHSRGARGAQRSAHAFDRYRDGLHRVAAMEDERAPLQARSLRSLTAHLSARRRVYRADVQRL